MEDLEDRVIHDNMDDLGRLQGSYPEIFISLLKTFVPLVGSDGRVVFHGYKDQPRADQNDPIPHQGPQKIRISWKWAPNRSNFVPKS